MRHALRVLSLFSSTDPQWSVTQVADTLHLSKSTASRLLATMAQDGFVTKDADTGRYQLGLRAYQVGLAYVSGLSLRRTAMPVLEEIAFVLHETVYLGILGDGVAINIDKILSPLSLRVDSHLGLAMPLHATALGKSLLAAMPDTYVESVIARGLRRYTRRTITDPAELYADLRLIRRRGYATDLEEFEENLHCAAFPLRSHNGRVVAAFSISGPAVRFTRQRIEQNIDAFTQAAAAISRQLGFDGHGGTAEEPLHTGPRPLRSGVRTAGRGS